MQDFKKKTQLFSGTVSFNLTITAKTSYWFYFSTNYK